MADKLFLRKVQLFADLQVEDLEIILQSGSEKRYRENEVIFHAEDLGSCIFILKSGLVKISICDKNGKEDILKVMYPFDFFGEMSILDGQHRSATVTAMEKSTAFIIEKNSFLKLIKEYPQIAFNMLATMCRRARKTNEKIASLRFADAYGKVARVLLDIADENGVREENGMVINLKLSRQELAELAGVTRETATRILAEFQENGCIEIGKRKISILNEAVLRRELL